MFRHQELEHTEAATRAHSSSEIFSLCASTINRQLFHSGRIWTRFHFWQDKTDKFLIINRRRNTWTRKPWLRGISFRKIGRHNNLSIFGSNKFLRLDRWHRSRHENGRDSSGWQNRLHRRRLNSGSGHRWRRRRYEGRHRRSKLRRGNKRRRSRNRRTGTGTGRTPGLRTVSGHVTWLLAAQAQTRKRAVPRQITGFVTNGTKDRLISMKHIYREISDGYRRRDRTTKRHYETTSIIGHRREITKETLVNGEDNTKGLERRLHITIRNFERQVRHKHGTNRLVSGGDNNRGKWTLKEIVPVLGSLACNADLSVFRKWTAVIFSTSRACSNWGATSDTPWVRRTLLGNVVPHFLQTASLQIQAYHKNVSVTFTNTVLRSVR